MARVDVIVLAAFLWCAPLWSSPAMAQSAPAPEDARLKLSGAFIGANTLVAALQGHCGGNYGDAPYDGASALAKLRGYVRADEFAILSDYIHSPDFAQERTVIFDKMSRAFKNASTTTPDRTEACRILAQSVLGSYAGAKADLERLR